MVSSRGSIGRFGNIRHFSFEMGWVILSVDTYKHSWNTRCVAFSLQPWSTSYQVLSEGMGAGWCLMGEGDWEGTFQGHFCPEAP